jgi:hypothetical protein
VQLALGTGRETQFLSAYFNWFDRSSKVELKINKDVNDLMEHLIPDIVKRLRISDGNNWRDWSNDERLLGILAAWWSIKGKYERH